MVEKGVINPNPREGYGPVRRSPYQSGTRQKCRGICHARINDVVRDEARPRMISVWRSSIAPGSVLRSWKRVRR